MHTRNILAIARKDALDILLNKTTLFFLVTPIILAALFAIIGGLLANKSASTGLLIYNPGHSTIEQYVGNVLTGTPVFHAHSADEVASTFGSQGSHTNSPYILGLIVPPNFDESLRAGGHPQLALYINVGASGGDDQQILEHALSDYARGVTNPQSPVSFSVTTTNLPATTNFVQDYKQRYAMAGLLYSLTIGIAFVPGLLVEEKEKKTMRMLMVSPASWSDVVLGKLLVALVYQLLISAAVLAILGSFSGQLLALLFFVLISSCFGLVVGLLFGSFIQTNGNVGTFVGIVSIAYTLPALVLGPLYIVLQGSSFEQAIKVLPMYYMADAFLKALQGQATLENTLLDVTVVMGGTVLLFFVAIWSLHRQAAVVGAI
jgi:ABC-2 type transport system permease protein